MNLSHNAPRQPSNMGHGFARVPTINIERSKFDRSHTIKTTFDANYLFPFLVDEVLPGDTLNAKLDAFIRMTTPLRPIMDNLYFDTFYFFVPNRLLWTNWEKFNGAQTDPGDSTSFTIPTVPMPAGGPEVGSLSDYFGIPTDQTNGFSVAALHYRAYNLIYNTWFRDQNLQDSLVVDTDDGPDTLTDYVIKKRGKRHDYFTSCLPWPQKGDASSIALGGSAPLVGTGNLSIPGLTGGHIRTDTLGVLTIQGSTQQIPSDPNNNYAVGVTTNINNANINPTMPAQNIAFSTIAAGMTANLSAATAVTINALRQAIQIQAFLERDARGGTRYVEIVKSRFGTTVPDFRVQRPEYLGGGSTPINMHPVPQTSPTSGSNPHGQLAAFATASVSNHGFTKSFVEHGVIIGIGNVRADLTYSQGLNRMWTRSTLYDFADPIFAHLGEQAVYNKEIYNDLADGTAANQRTGVFGYQERFAEYRHKQSQITGLFRPAYATPLDTWHVSQEFSAQPSLNAAFIEEDTPLDRVVAVPSEPHFYMDAFMHYKHARPLPVFSIPQLGARL